MFKIDSIMDNYSDPYSPTCGDPRGFKDSGCLGMLICMPIVIFFVFFMLVPVLFEAVHFIEEGFNMYFAWLKEIRR